MRGQRSGPALLRFGRPEFPFQKRPARLERRKHRFADRGSLDCALGRAGDRAPATLRQFEARAALVLAGIAAVILRPEA